MKDKQYPIDNTYPTTKQKTTQEENENISTSVISTSVIPKDIINTLITELGYEYKDFGWYNKSTIGFDSPIKNDIFVEAIRNEILRKKIFLTSRETIQKGIDMIEYDYEQQNEAKCLKHIAYDPNVKDNSQEIIDCICENKKEKLYPTILRHLIWTIKNRIKGGEDVIPIFINFYGGAGVCKSEFLNKLFNGILPPHTFTNSNSGNSLFSDDRFSYQLKENYVIILNELGSLSKTNIDKIKNIIDSRYLDGRILGKNKSNKGKIKSQLIGTSNTPFNIILSTTDEIRKWCEIDFYAPPPNDAGEYKQNKYKEIQALDILSLWRSVDENAPTPLLAVEKEFQLWTQEKCQTKTELTDWLEEYIIYNDIKGINRKTHTKRKDLFQEYKRSMENEGVKDIKILRDFSAEIKKWGFDEDDTNYERRLLIPTIEQCPKILQKNKMLLKHKNISNITE